MRLSAVHQRSQQRALARSEAELALEPGMSAHLMPCVTLPAHDGSPCHWLTAHASRCSLLQAKGTIIANFDDDDVYCRPHLSRMVSAMQTSHAAVVKLASFLYLEMVGTSGSSQPPLASIDDDTLRETSPEVRTVDDGSAAASRSDADRKRGDHRLRGRYLLRHCDVDHASGSQMGGVPMAVPHQAAHGVRWGYGFSVVHQTFLAASCPYRCSNFGEDCVWHRTQHSRNLLPCVPCHVIASYCVRLCDAACFFSPPRRCTALR